MNKQILEQNLNEVVEGLKTMGSSDLPLIFEEIIRAAMVLNTILAVSAIAFAMGIIFVIEYKDGYDGGVYDGWVVVTTAFTLVSSLVCLLMAILDLSFALTSPKLYVLKYLKDFF